MREWFAGLLFSTPEWSGRATAPIRVYRAEEVDEEIARLQDATAVLERSLKDQVLENERLLKAICKWDRYIRKMTNLDPFDPMTDFPPEEMALFEIAREGR